MPPSANDHGGQTRSIEVNQPTTNPLSPVTSVHYVSEWRLIACLPSTHSARVSANHASGDPQSGGGFSLNSFCYGM